MASPFPGMDPYIESQCWADFHHTLIDVLRAVLVPQTRPYYVVRVEERVYVEHVPPDGSEYIRPDGTVLEHPESEGTLESPAAPVTTATLTPRLFAIIEAKR